MAQKHLVTSVNCMSQDPDGRTLGFLHFIFIFKQTNKQKENPDVVSPQKTESLWHLPRFENQCL